MNTKILMVVSAAFMAVLGLAAMFLPEELVAAVTGLEIDELLGSTLEWIGQLIGSMYLGFAFLNWTARESVMGGIYGRPLVLGNLMHFFVGTLALWKAVGRVEETTGIMIVAAAYTVLAVLFGRVMFVQPKAMARGSAQN